MREIGVVHGITHTTVRTKAKAEGWTRSLKEQIDAKTKEIITQATAVSAETETLEDSKNSKAINDYETLTVNAAAKVIADVMLSHRVLINRYRSLAVAMLSELEVETENRDLFNQLGELLAKPDDKGVDKLNELYHKVISLPVRVDSLKKLSEVLKTLIALEREAFNIDSQDKPDNPLQPVLEQTNQNFSDTLALIRQKIKESK